MKNLIAISAAALTAATANAAVFITQNSGTWLTAVQTAYPTVSFYTDTLHNATQATPGGNVVGGHGWGAWTASNTVNTGTLSISGTGAATNVVSTSSSPNDNQVSFAFANSQGLNGGMYALGIYFTVSNTAAQTPNPFVLAAFSSGSASVTSGFVTPGVNFVGIWSNANETVTSITLSFEPGTITVTDLEYGLVPAPGALALVGAAGLIGSRRRRA